MLQIVTVKEPAVRPEQIPEQLRDIEPIDIAGAKERRLELTIGRQDQHLTMGINGRPYWKALPLEVEVGDTEVWDVVNDTDFAHPFHLHGFFFQVLDDTRVPEWKDTVNVPSKSQLKLGNQVRRASRYVDVSLSHPRHAEVGMMGHLRLRERGTPVPTEAPAHGGHAGHPMAPSRAAQSRRRYGWLTGPPAPQLT